MGGLGRGASEQKEYFSEKSESSFLRVAMGTKNSIHLTCWYLVDEERKEIQPIPEADREMASSLSMGLGLFQVEAVAWRFFLSDETSLPTVWEQRKEEGNWELCLSGEYHNVVQSKVCVLFP